MKKKLLFISMVGSLFITMAATASEVVSTNIVGYVLDGGSKVGFRQIAPPFISVLDDNQMFTLDRITGNFNQSDTLQFIDTSNNTYSPSTVNWITPALANAMSNQRRPGWHSGREYVGDLEYPAGTGILLLTSMTGNPVDVYISGQVDTMPTTNYVIAAGFYTIGNSSPVTNLLENITFTGLRQSDTLQFVDFNNNTYSPFTVNWVTEAMAPAMSNQRKAGWHMGRDYVGDIRYLVPGQGFTLSTQSSLVEIIIPAPFIN